MCMVYYFRYDHIRLYTSTPAIICLRVYVYISSNTFANANGWLPRFRARETIQPRNKNCFNVTGIRGDYLLTVTGVDSAERHFNKYFFLLVWLEIFDGYGSPCHKHPGPQHVCMPINSGFGTYVKKRRRSGSFQVSRNLSFKLCHGNNHCHGECRGPCDRCCKPLPVCMVRMGEGWVGWEGMGGLVWVRHIERTLVAERDIRPQPSRNSTLHRALYTGVLFLPPRCKYGRSFLPPSLRAAIFLKLVGCVS